MPILGGFIMLRQMPKQLSFHTTLYNKILKNHILKTIKDTVDFSFLNELSANIYCKNFGCPAKEPGLMCKLLFLQAMYGQSDEKLIEDAMVKRKNKNKDFLGIRQNLL
jgi:transposase